MTFKSGITVSSWAIAKISPPQVVSPGPLSSKGAALPLIPCAEINTRYKSLNITAINETVYQQLTYVTDKHKERQASFTGNGGFIMVFFLECFVLKTATVTHSVIIPRWSPP